MAINRQVIGAGFHFPLQNDAAGGVNLSREADNVRQSIMLILGTARGERVYRPDFGCDINDILFEANTLVTAAKIEYEVKRSLVEFEPRIGDIEVKAEPDDSEMSRMNVHLSYVIRSDNTRDNMVYPFYLKNEEQGI